MQLELLNRIGALEVKHSELNVTQSYISTKLEHIEELVEKNQEAVTLISQQLTVNQIRLKTLKAALITMSTWVAAVSSFHLKPLLSLIHSVIS